MGWLLGLLLLGLGSNSFAQRTAVSAKEVTGTFRETYRGTHLYQEVRILALGGNKLYVEFDFVWPSREHFGWTRGFAWIYGDSAVFRGNNEWVDSVEASEIAGDCVITLKFIKPGKLIVNDGGHEANAGCGFGYGVTGTGKYHKVSGKRPELDQAYRVPERKSVSSKEVTGIFRQTSKNKISTIRISALGENKLRITLEALYLRSNKSETFEGTAVIFRDLALCSELINPGESKCRVAIKFTKPGQLMLTDFVRSQECNVVIDWGDYLKVSDNPEDD